MLFSSIYQPSKKTLSKKPTTLSEKKYKKYLRSKLFKYNTKLNLLNLKYMIFCFKQDDRINYLDNLNYCIDYANICSSRHRKSKFIEHVKVPEDKEIIVDTKKGVRVLGC